MTVSSRVLSGSIVKGSTMSESGSIKCFVQGIDLVDASYVDRPAASIRSHAGTVLSIDNKKPTDEFTPFNDLNTPFRYGDKPVVVVAMHAGVTSSHFVMESPYRAPGPPGTLVGGKVATFKAPGRDFTLQRYINGVLRTANPSPNALIEVKILPQTSSLSFLDTDLTRTHNVFSHKPEAQDFGMPDAIGNSSGYTPFEDFGSHSRKEELSRAIVEFQDPNKEFLIPDGLTNNDENIGIDGTIDVLMSRARATRSSIFWPHEPRGIKGGYGVEQDVFFRNSVITDKISLLASGNLTSPFFDGNEYFAPDLLNVPSSSISSREMSVLGPIPIQALETETFHTIKPFVDDMDDLKLRTEDLSNDPEIQRVLRRRGPNLGAGLKSELQSSSSLSAGNEGLQRGEKYAAHGFDYIGSDYGIDNIVYGGLKK